MQRSDGLWVYEEENGHRSLSIDSERLEYCIQVYNSENFNGVEIRKTNRQDDSIGFLRRLSRLERISISAPKIFDIEVLHDFPKLQRHAISDMKRGGIDFSKFKSLVYFAGRFSEKDCGISELENLEYLKVTGCLPMNLMGECKELPKSLIRLQIAFCKSDFLSIGSSSPNLADLNIYRFGPQLSLDRMATFAPNLEILTLEGGSLDFQIDPYVDHLSACQKLKVVLFASGGKCREFKFDPR